MTERELPNERQHAIEQTVRHYYTAIDAGDVDQALTLFPASEDEKDPVVYVRGSRTFTGLEAIHAFYQVRGLSGTHMVQELAVTGDQAYVAGRFTGEHNVEGQVNFAFTDRMEFRGNYVIRRETSFPEGKEY